MDVNENWVQYTRLCRKVYNVLHLEKIQKNRIVALAD